MNKITSSVFYVGVNDHKVDLFEGHYVVPHGMSYNSYVVVDDLITIFDTVDQHFFKEWMKNIKEVLGKKKPNFLVVQHMEPDHSANIINFLKVYPDTYVVGNEQTFRMIDQYFHTEIKHKMVVNDGGALNTGKHIFNFVFAPMVHWPEVMVTYDNKDKILFSADGFGKFGALDHKEPWDDEARRYYIGIVGKYGFPVQQLLGKASKLDIKTICPLHGPILKSDLNHYIGLYDTWSSYKSEVDGVAVFYTSVYGHTKDAVLSLVDNLKKQKVKNIKVTDLARCDMSQAVADAFKYSKIVLATTTYNMSIFPYMHEFIINLVERNFQNKTIGIIENGTWAPNALNVIKSKFADSTNIKILEPTITIMSSVSKKNLDDIKTLSVALAKVENKGNESKQKKPEKKKRKWRCKICGYVFEGYELPKDFKCPLCKHSAEDFVEIKD